MPWITATTATRNPTDTMIPSSVKNERSLWLQAVWSASRIASERGMGLQNSEMRDAGCEMRDGWGAGPHPASPITHPVYSYLNASTGSSLAALLAGYRPNPLPVRAEEARAASTDQSGTCAGMGVRLAMANATTPPASIPTAPPTRVSVEASTRNCHRMA